MSFIDGLELAEVLYESDRSLVVRAARTRDGESVVVKLLKNDFPTVAELARYRLEFELMSSLELSGIVRGLELCRHGKTLAIVLEDFGGLSIAEYIRERPMSHEEFLDAAIQIAAALDGLHRAGIIHKDVSPSNIVINPSTGEVRIIDFGIATRFSREQPVLKSPEVLEGTLPYMSPEQTGRMNRSLDYRSDLYSLGATF